jgi:hypothetical protein
MINISHRGFLFGLNEFKKANPISEHGTDCKLIVGWRDKQSVL